MTDQELERVAGRAASAIGRLIRMGFGTKGLVTILVGVLALRYALGTGGGLTGQQGAIESIVGHPLGRVALVVLAVGLAGYALWMFVAALVDPERKGLGFKGLAERVGFFVTGAGYSLLAFASVRLLSGQGNGGGAGLDDLAATVLTPHAGRVLVGLIGVIVMTAGVLQLRLGITAGFRESLRPGMSRAERVVTVASGSVGYVALGTLSLLVGYSLFRVAVEYDPSEARGWEESLRLLSGLGEGRWILAAAALGLILYGVYFLLLARYRQL